MRVSRTSNARDIKSVLAAPYETMRGDGEPSLENLELFADGLEYIGGYIEEEIFAIMLFHRYRDGQKIHITVEQGNKNGRAHKFGRLALRFRDSTLPLYTEIPACFPRTIEFAKSFGFEIIETHAGKFIRNGRPHDSKIMRVTE